MKQKPIYIKQCKHDLAERETACADGMCPICLLDTVVVQRAAMMSTAVPDPDVMRAVLWLVSKGGNIRAHVHALMHINPKIAIQNGYPSLRSSAKACGVSTEYIRRLRNLYIAQFKQTTNQ